MRWGFHHCRTHWIQFDIALTRAQVCLGLQRDEDLYRLSPSFMSITIPAMIDPNPTDQAHTSVEIQPLLQAHTLLEETQTCFPIRF